MSKRPQTAQLLPDPKIDPLPRRRTFTAAYKAAIVAECDAASEPGEVGAILRREGLYSSYLADWRQRRAEGGLGGLGPKKTGRPPKDPAARALEKENARLLRENARLQEKLRKSQIIVEAQKKLGEVLASLSASTSGSTE